MSKVYQELLEEEEYEKLSLEVRYKLERAFYDQQKLKNQLEARNVQLYAELVEAQRQLKQKSAFLAMTPSQATLLESLEKLLDEKEVLQSQSSCINAELRSRIAELRELEREKGSEILELKENLAYKEDEVMRLEEQISSLRSVSENLQKQVEALLGELKEVKSLEEQSRFSRDNLQKEVEEFKSKLKQNENNIYESEIEVKVLQEHLQAELPECHDSFQFGDGLKEQTSLELAESKEPITLPAPEENTLEPVEDSESDRGQTRAAEEEHKEEMEVCEGIQESMDITSDKDNKQREDPEETTEAEDSALDNKENLTSQNAPNSAEDAIVTPSDPPPAGSNIRPCHVSPVVVSESTATSSALAESEASASAASLTVSIVSSGKRVTFMIEDQEEPCAGEAMLLNSKRKHKCSALTDRRTKYSYGMMSSFKKMKMCRPYGAKRSLLTSLWHEASATQSSDQPAPTENYEQEDEEESEEDQEDSDQDDDTDILEESDDNDKEDGQGSGEFTFDAGDAADAGGAPHDSGKEEKTSGGNECQGAGDDPNTGRGAENPTTIEEKPPCVQEPLCCLPLHHVFNALLEENKKPAEVPAGAGSAADREERFTSRNVTQAAAYAINGEAVAGGATFDRGGPFSYFDKQSLFPLLWPHGPRFIFPSFQTFHQSSNYFDTPKENFYGYDDQAVPQPALFMLPLYLDQPHEAFHFPQVPFIPRTKLNPPVANFQANSCRFGEFPSQEALTAVEELKSATHEEGNGHATTSPQGAAASVVLRPELAFFHRMLKFNCQELAADPLHVCSSVIALDDESTDEATTSSDCESYSSSLSNFYSDSSADHDLCRLLDLDSQLEEEVPCFLMDPLSTSEDSYGSVGIPFDLDGR